MVMKITKIVVKEKFEGIKLPIILNDYEINDGNRSYMLSYNQVPSHVITQALHLTQARKDSTSRS
jgi:hypothetical protein